MKKILALALGLGLVAISCNQNHLYMGGTVTLERAQIHVDIANTDATRALGLGGRSDINDSEGMWFEFDTASRYGFWMKDMNFPIDIIWIANSQVVDITSGAMPQPGVPDGQLQVYAPQLPVDRVLEVKSGWADRHGVGIGDQVTFTPAQ